MTELKEVKGVGPSTVKKLNDINIKTAEELAAADQEAVIAAGIGKATAAKIIANAQEVAGTQEPAKPKKTETVKKKEKEAIEESKRSPAPQGIPTKKKRGVQIRSTKDDAPRERVEKQDGWVVEAKKLSKEDLEKRKKRQEEMSRAAKITRPIPERPMPVKAEKEAKKGKSEKPVRKERVGRDALKKKKKVKKVIAMYSEDDLVHQEPSTRRKGVSAKPGEKKPRIQLDRETFIGRITSHRRSRRVINNTQMIVQLENDFNSDQIVGQNIYFRYPHTNQRVAGRISKRFGKSSSRKVIAKFPKGIATQAHNAKIFIK